MPSTCMWMFSDGDRLADVRDVRYVVAAPDLDPLLKLVARRVSVRDEGTCPVFEQCSFVVFRGDE